MFTMCVDLLWALFKRGLVVLAVLGILIVGYLYVRLDDEIRAKTRQILATHYPSLNIEIGNGRLDRDHGIQIQEIAIREPQPSGYPKPLLSIGELQLQAQLNVDDLLSCDLKIERVVVKRPELVVRRSTTGHWSITSLLPLPNLGGDGPPPISIVDGTLVFIDESRPLTAPLVLRGGNILVRPDTNAPPGQQRKSLIVHGEVRGGALQTMQVEGRVSLEDGSVDLSFQWQGLELSADMLAIALQKERQPTSTIPQITGRIDGQMRLHYQPSSPVPLTSSGQLAIRQGRIEHPSLPYPLTELEATGHFDEKGLSIDKLTGKLGMTDVLLALRRRGWQSHAPLASRIRLSGLSLDQNLFAVTPPALQRIWKRFSPAGSVDVAADLQFDGQRLLPHCVVSCRDGSVTDREKFPYPLSGVAGTLTFSQQASSPTATLSLDLVGRAAERPVQIKGTIREIHWSILPLPEPPPPPGFDLHVAAQDVPIHSELVRALPEVGRKVVQSLSASGNVDCHWHGLRPPGPDQQVESTTDLTLRDCTIQFDKFPYPLRDVQGRVTGRNKVWTFQNLESRTPHRSLVVTCQGDCVPNERGLLLRLLLRGSEVPLDETLWRALPANVQAVWSSLRPQGKIRLAAQIEHQFVTGIATKPEISVSFQPERRSVSIYPTFFPYRFEQIDGEFRFADNRLQIQDGRAEHGRTEFLAQGSWQPLPDRGWHMEFTDLAVDRLTPDRDLIVAVPPKLRHVLDELKPEGMFTVNHGKMAFTKRDTANSPFIAQWDVQVNCHQADIQCGFPLQDLTGAIQLTGATDGSRSYSSGELDFDSMFCRGFQLTEVKGPLWIDSRQVLLGRGASAVRNQPSRGLTADAYGGSLAANISLSLDGRPNYRVEGTIANADLKRVAEERGFSAPELSGTVNGKIELSGTGAATHSLNGDGELHLVDANIYQLPVLVSLLKVLRNRTPDSTAFNRCDASFAIRGEHVQFEQLNLLGDAVSLYGRGEVGFDRHLNLTFHSFVGRNPLPIPVLRDLVGQASEQMLRIRVDGSLDSPMIHREALPAVGQVLQQIQNELQSEEEPAETPDWSARLPGRFFSR